VQCLNGCSDFLFDPADEAKRQNVEKIVEGTREAIQLAEEQEGDNAQWMRHQKKVLSNGLKVLESEEDPESSHVQPFEGEGSNFEPFDDDDFIPIEEAREELEEDTEF
jgi:Arc/MetJ-type ribon-helix-helix transcriptional regulator